MKASILSFTRAGAQLSLEIKSKFKKGQPNCYTMDKWAEPEKGLEGIGPEIGVLIGRLFQKDSALVFIGACGIAVRMIAPFVKDKKTDPAVLCIDEKGNYVIPVLSGHIGGANRLAKEIAEKIGADPVITTATDINRRFSVDEWAAVNGLYLGNMAAAKKISALLLEHQRVGFLSDFQREGELPDGLEPEGGNGFNGSTGICVSVNEKKKPFETTLVVIPKVIYLGVGCRKGITAEAIEEFVTELLEKENISFHAIKGIATINIKREEEGLLDFARKYSLPVFFFDAEELLEVRGEFSSSEFVRKITGVENVCERAAVLASGSQELLCGKVSKDGMTAAIAQRNWRVSFEY